MNRIPLLILAAAISTPALAVPETYVIDKAGVIRMKHTGPISPDVLGNKIMPLLVELNK